MLRRVSRGHYRVSYRSEPVMEFEGDEFRGELQLRQLVTPERQLDLQYDGLGRLTTAVDRSRRAQEERRFEFRYDAQGHVDRVFEVQPASEPSETSDTTSPRGLPLCRGRGPSAGAGRVVRHMVGTIRRVSQDDEAGGRTRSTRSRTDTMPLGGASRHWGRTGYGPRLWSISRTNNTRAARKGGAVSEYHYDADGVITKVVDPYGGMLRRERDAEDGWRSKSTRQGGR